MVIHRFLMAASSSSRHLHGGRELCSHGASVAYHLYYPQKP